MQLGNLEKVEDLRGFGELMILIPHHDLMS